MKIEVKKNKEYTETIEVEFPYYYENSYSDYNDCTYYKKIMPDYYIEIVERMDFKGVEIEYEMWRDKNNLSADIYDNENKSTKERFDAVKERAIKFLKDIE